MEIAKRTNPSLETIMRMSEPVQIPLGILLSVPRARGLKKGFLQENDLDKTNQPDCFCHLSDTAINQFVKQCKNTFATNFSPSEPQRCCIVESKLRRDHPTGGFLFITMKDFQ
jgi:hypothetical protein